MQGARCSQVGKCKQKAGDSSWEDEHHPRNWHKQVSFCLPTENFAGMLIAGELLELFKMASSKNLEMALNCVCEL